MELGPGLSRLFVAVWPPEDVLDRVAAMARPEIDGLRWTSRHQWHVTLRFLGECDVPAVVTALAGVVAGPCRAELGPAIGRFDHRVLHIPVRGVEELAGAVGTATAHLGRRPETRPFQGHLTLARVANGAKVDLRSFARAEVEARWTVQSFCLVESRLSPAGAKYKVVETFDL